LLRRLQNDRSEDLKAARISQPFCSTADSSHSYPEPGI